MLVVSSKLYIQLYDVIPIHLIFCVNEFCELYVQEGKSGQLLVILL